MTARVFKVDELATRIATHLVAISPAATIALALTCKALEVPALRAFWGVRLCSLNNLIMRLLSTEVWHFVFQGDDRCLLVSLPPLVQWAFCMLIDHEKINRRCSDHLLRGS